MLKPREVGGGDTKIKHKIKPFGLVAARTVHLVFSLQTIPALATDKDCCSIASWIQVLNRTR